MLVIAYQVDHIRHQVSGNGQAYFSPRRDIQKMFCLTILEGFRTQKQHETTPGSPGPSHLAKSVGVSTSSFVETCQHHEWFKDCCRCFLFPLDVLLEIWRCIITFLTFPIEKMHNLRGRRYPPHLSHTHIPIFCELSYTYPNVSRR